MISMVGTVVDVGDWWGSCCESICLGSIRGERCFIWPDDGWPQHLKTKIFSDPLRSFNQGFTDVFTLQSWRHSRMQSRSATVLGRTSCYNGKKNRSKVFPHHAFPLQYEHRWILAESSSSEFLRDERSLSLVRQWSCIHSNCDNGYEPKR